MENPSQPDPVSYPEPAAEAPRRLSAKANRHNGSPWTEAEIEAAEEEALTWARRVNSC